MVRVLDIEAENRKVVLEKDGGYFGFVDIAFLDCPPFAMFTAGDCSVANQVLEGGHFDPGSLRLWSALARAASGIADIGAYTGIYALTAASLRPDLTVHAFEPNPYSMARLRINRSVNKLWNIEDHLCGGAAETGHAALTWLRKKTRPLTSTATFARGGGDARYEKVLAEIRPLSPDIAATLGPRALLKVDVEGLEASVLRGLGDMLRQRPDFILETFSADACAQMNALLGPLGYKAYVIPESGGALQPTGDIKPRSEHGKDFNQLLSCRPPPDGFL